MLRIENKAGDLTSDQIESYRHDMSYVLDRLLSGSCIITSIDLTEAVRRGLYLIMSAYGLGMRSCARADWEWIELCEDDNSPALNAEKIKNRGFDEEKFLSACAALKAKYDNAAADNKPERSDPDPDDTEPRFGWLSPSGDFTPSPFGSHDDSAEEIIKARGWMDQFCEWDVSDLYRDFLIYAKGYVLLHNPNGNCFDPFVTCSGETPLTSAQNIFLHDYYLKIGNVVRAGLYE